MTTARTSGTTSTTCGGRCWTSPWAAKAPKGEERDERVEGEGDDEPEVDGAHRSRRCRDGRQRPLAAAQARARGPARAAAASGGAHDPEGDAQAAHPSAPRLRRHRRRLGESGGAEPAPAPCPSSSSTSRRSARTRRASAPAASARRCSSSRRPPRRRPPRRRRRRHPPPCTPTRNRGASTPGSSHSSEVYRKLHEMRSGERGKGRGTRNALRGSRADAVPRPARQRGDARTLGKCAV